MPSCLPPPQLSPCSSPTMDWWTSSRPSSPPPPPLPRQPVLLPCSAIAIYSCPPLSPRNTFTPHRYPLTLSFAFITKTKQQMSWRAGIHVFCLLVSEIVLQNYTTHSPHVSVEHRLWIILTCNVMFGPNLAFLLALYLFSLPLILYYLRSKSASVGIWRQLCSDCLFKKETLTISSWVTNEYLFNCIFPVITVCCCRNFNK